MPLIFPGPQDQPNRPVSYFPKSGSSTFQPVCTPPEPTPNPSLCCEYLTTTKSLKYTFSKQLAVPSGPYTFTCGSISSTGPIIDSLSCVTSHPNPELIGKYLIYTDFSTTNFCADQDNPSSIINYPSMVTVALKAVGSSCTDFTFVFDSFYIDEGGLPLVSVELVD